MKRARVPSRSAKPRRHRSATTIQTRILFLMLMVLIPVFVVQIGFYYDGYLDRREMESQINERVAQRAAEIFHEFIRDVLREMLVVSKALTTSEPLCEEDVQWMLRVSKEEIPAVGELAWADPEGRILASSERGLLGTDIRDQSFFSDVVAGKEWVLTDLLHVPGSPTSGFAISRGVYNESGVLLGVIVALILPERLGVVLRFDRFGASTLDLTDRSGLVAYRYPEGAWGQEEQNGAEQAMHDIRKRNTMASVILSQVHGERNIVAIAPVGPLGWMVSAGRPEVEVMTPLVGRYAHQTALFLFVSLSAFLSALLISRGLTVKIQRLRDYALLLGRGQFGRPIDPSGPIELRDLAGALGAIARDIHAREEGLLRIQDELELRVQERTSELSVALETLKTEIVERNRAEDALELERKRLFSLLNSLPAFVSLTGPDHDIRFANQHFRNLFGSIEGKCCYEVTEGRNRPCRHCLAIDVFAGGRCREWEWMHTTTGRTYQVYSYPFADTDGSPVALIFGMDITQRKRAEEALRDSENQLRFLSSKLLASQEEERRRIARELHDSIGSSLSAIKFSLENLRNRGGRGVYGSELLAALIDMTHRAIDESRRIMTDLRPSTLDDLGLVVTISWFCREFRKVYGDIYVEEEVDVLEEEIHDPLKIVIFRIMQEALNNVTKYSKAEFVTVSLVKNGEQIELTVEDNGEGFDMEAVLSAGNPRRGLGLSSMKERAELSGGTFTIQSTRGVGTTVKAVWPKDTASIGRPVESSRA